MREVMIMPYIPGRDVSSWDQNRPDYDGFDFVVVKITEGRTYLNPRWHSQVASAREGKLVVGHYHFVVDTSRIADQVAHFLDHAPNTPEEFLVLDWESTGVSGAEKDAFLDAVKRARPGQRVLLYCNADFWITRDATSNAGDGLWIADWNSPAGKPSVRHEWTIHQYTDNPYDKNVANFGSREEFAAWVRGNASPGRLTHVIAKGDTFAHLADRYKVSVEELILWNEETLLVPGQRLNVSPPASGKPAPGPDPYTDGLPVVGRTNPSARHLQAALQAAGYLASDVEQSDNYGQLTQAAVTSFYLDTPREVFDGYVSPQIGPLGWTRLRLLAEQRGGGQPPPAVRVASPVPHVAVSYPFGVRNARYRIGFHTGDDYAAPAGTPVVAVRDGIIAWSNGDGGDYGQWIGLRAPNGRDYVYCHLSRRDVAAGQAVKAGTKLGLVGSTGNTTGPHLHFEDRPTGGGYGSVRKPQW